MATEKFTKQDLGLLLEAVEIWEREYVAPGRFGATLLSALGSNAELKKAVEVRKEAAERLKERGCALKTKLLQMKDDIE